MLFKIFTILYVFSLACLSIYGLQALFLSFLYLLKRKKTPITPPEPTTWPKVTIQLPIYNEKYVVSRLIDAVCKLDYPTNQLSIQVLDDSTDETTARAARKVREYQQRRIDIQLIHRTNRSGYKAGALAAATTIAKGELIAIFDADFIPPTDFLKRLVPHFTADSRLGLVQARWGHLNATENLATRGQAIFLDGHFVIEQTARSRSGLLWNFNGSGGIWRKDTILDAGGWQADTLTEDLDLSYRAQLVGWKALYVPDVIVPGQLPPQLAAFQKQQYRWARGGMQVLHKLFSRLVKDKHLSLQQRLMALLHLSGYITQPLLLIFILSCMPVILNHGLGLPPMPWLPLAGLGAPLLFLISQVAGYQSGYRQLINLPILILLGTGLALSNTRAVIDSFKRNSGVFVRTPKFSQASCKGEHQAYRLTAKLDGDTIGEILLAIYSAVTLVFAIADYPAMIPAMAMFTLAFSFLGISILVQSQPRRHRSKKVFHKGLTIQASQTPLPSRVHPTRTRLY